VIIRKFLFSLDRSNCISSSNYNTEREKFFSKIKDSPPSSEKKPGGVYKVPCSDCPDVYVEWCQKYRDDNTALSDHYKEKLHNFYFGETIIVGRESNNKERKILEVINVLQSGECVNCKTDSLHLFNTSAGILNVFRVSFRFVFSLLILSLKTVQAAWPYWNVR